MAVKSAGTRQSIKNTVHKVTVSKVARKIYNIGSYEAGKTIVDEVPVISLSAALTGSINGFGSMLHRNHLNAEKATGGQVEFWNVPQAETGGAAAAEGEVDFAGSVGVLAGTYSFYIGFDLVRVPVLDADTPTLLGDALELAINNNVDLNFTASNAIGVVTITSKTLGLYGNAATGAQFSENLESAQELPAGVATALTQPVGGTGLPDIQDALNGMGTGDGANGNFATAVIHGYGQDSTTLDAIRDYVGAGDELLGLFKKTVARPFRSAVGDVSGISGLTALLAVGNGRTTDRATNIVPVSSSESHPSDIAAQYIGHLERTAKEETVKGYTKIAFSRIGPGPVGDRWTNDETNRDAAINAGLCTTLVEGGVVKIMDAVSLYHPNSIPENSNIYRESVNMPKIQNMLNDLKVVFNGPPFLGAAIVEDINTVGSIGARSVTIDQDIVIGKIFELLDAWQDESYVFETAFAKSELAVAIRDATDGFDSIIKLILSGINKVNDNQILADISAAVVS